MKVLFASAFALVFGTLANTALALTNSPGAFANL